MKGNALLGAAAASETRAQGKFVETRVILEEGFSQASEFVQPARRTKDHRLLLVPLFPSEKEASTLSSLPRGTAKRHWVLMALVGLEMALPCWGEQPGSLRGDGWR